MAFSRPALTGMPMGSGLVRSMPIMQQVPRVMSRPAAMGNSIRRAPIASGFAQSKPLGKAIDSKPARPAAVPNKVNVVNRSDKPFAKPRLTPLSPLRSIAAAAHLPSSRTATAPAPSQRPRTTARSSPSK